MNGVDIKKKSAISIQAALENSEFDSPLEGSDSCGVRPTTTVVRHCSVSSRESQIGLSRPQYRQAQAFQSPRYISLDGVTGLAAYYCQVFRRVQRVGQVPCMYPCCVAGLGKHAFFLHNSFTCVCGALLVVRTPLPFPSRSDYIFTLRYCTSSL